MKEYDFESLTLQGELIGEGIQKNKYGLKGQHVKFFRMFNPKSFEFIQYDLFLEIMNKYGLETVPIINTNFTLPETYEELIQMGDGKSMLKDTTREGIVLVAKNSKRNNKRLSFKVLNNKFLLKHNE